MFLLLPYLIKNILSNGKYLGDIIKKFTLMSNYIRSSFLFQRHIERREEIDEGD